MAAVKALVDEDSCYTVKEMAKSKDISEGNVHEILSKKLGLKNVCARWLPHLLDQRSEENESHLFQKTLKAVQNS